MSPQRPRANVRAFTALEFPTTVYTKRLNENQQRAQFTLAWGRDSTDENPRFVPLNRRNASQATPFSNPSSAPPRLRGAHVVREIHG